MGVIGCPKCINMCKTCKLDFQWNCMAGKGDWDYIYASSEWIEENKHKFPTKPSYNESEEDYGVRLSNAKKLLDKIKDN